MNRFTYSLLLYLLTPFVILKLLWRSKKAPAYRKRWAERFGLYSTPYSGRPVIWVHSVSVGETIASAPTVKALIKHYPDHQILITTMTPTGSDRVKAIYGDSVEHVYVPYDLPGAQHRFLEKYNPSIAIVIETELWPNTIAKCHQKGIPVIIANARLSERSAKGYSKLGQVTRNMLGKLTVVACQNSEDGQRFIDLGLPKENLEIIGSVKFDLTIDQNTLNASEKLRHQWEKGLGKPVKILIAASTHEGEDAIILSAYKSLLKKCQDILLILVPRHPERFDSTYELIKQNNLIPTRHSEGSITTPNTQVILGDTMGEMMKLYGAADIAFVGGSLVERGGHNTLEPAALGLPVLSGPHTFNFKEINHSLGKAGGLVTVSNGQELTLEVEKFLTNKEQIAAIGNNAAAFVKDNQGAQAKLIEIISKTLK